MRDSSGKFIARTAASLEPDLVDPAIYGPHSSEVRGDVRLWKFDLESGRNAFLRAISEGKFRRAKQNEL